MWPGNEASVTWDHSTKLGCTGQSRVGLFTQRVKCYVWADVSVFVQKLRIVDLCYIM